MRKHYTLRLCFYSIMSLCLIMLSVLSGCNGGNVGGAAPSSLPEPPQIEAPQKEPDTSAAPEASENSAPELSVTYTLFNIDLNLPPEERQWQKTRIKIESEEPSISDVMWMLRGKTEFENLPEVATITENRDYSHDFIINVTSPDFMGDENFFADLCVTYLVGIGSDYYTTVGHSAGGMANVYILYNGEPAADLPVYDDGSFQFPYYNWSFYWPMPDYDLKHCVMTGQPGVWLPRELYEIQKKLKRPIITQSPHMKTANIFLDDEEQPQECIDELKTLTVGQKAQIKELFDSSDLVKNKLQGFLTAVIPHEIFYYNEMVSFSEPLEAPPWFIQQVARRFAPCVSFSKYVPERYGAGLEQVYDALYPIPDIAQPINEVAQLGVDVDTVAAELFGDYDFKRQQIRTTWNKDHYNRYTNTYGFSMLGGVGYWVEPYHIILDYADNGDSYDITAVLLWREGYRNMWHSDPLEWYADAGTFYKPAGFVEMLNTELPKIKITLKKNGKGGYFLHSYEPVDVE